MKKFSILIIIFLSYLFISFSFTQDSFYNIVEEVEKIEINDYYGSLSLLVDLHLEIARGESSDNPIFFAVELISELKYYSNMDIIDYLGHSFDIQKTLDNLLSDISILLTQSESAKHYIKNNLLLLKTNKTDCDGLKEISDKNFSISLKELDIKNMDINLNKSLEYAKCSSDNRINYNAQDKILGELDFYYTILQHKYDYFSRQRSAIIENYPQILYQLKK
ncbi:MAG: hypothetical protein M0P94_00795 [Candidatus Absconditabacterales bacterium]|nr:hypothetical protein [Candidatus Absconditabacterales bacterium]